MEIYKTIRNTLTGITLLALPTICEPNCSSSFYEPSKASAAKVRQVEPDMYQHTLEAVIEKK